MREWMQPAIEMWGYAKLVEQFGLQARENAELLDRFLLIKREVLLLRSPKRPILEYLW